MFVGERVVFYVAAADGIWKLLVESSAVRKHSCVSFASR
jgi:hypothetical protein